MPAIQPAFRRSLRRRGLGAREFALAAFVHDIRTSLTGILALGELLASSNLGERERRWALGVKTSAEHLASLTTLAVDAAETGAHSLTLQEEVFRPLRLIEALTDLLSVRAQTKGLESAVKVAGDLPDILVGDAVRLRAVLDNLIDNAIKFTERGAVRMEARTGRAARGHVRLVFTVSDSGIGITPAEIKRLFRPFAQASADIARRYGGAGLGLAMARRLAKLMGGDLTVTSAPGGGATFRFTAVLRAATAQHKRPRLISTPVRRLGILCADENPYGRVILNTILTELGYRAEFVASGEEAVAAAPRGYDVALMGINLSGIDGLEATRRIRTLPGAAGRTPIIGIAGASDAGDEAAARAAGMDAYLRKPISASALNEAIAAAMATRGRVSGPTESPPQVE